MDLNAKTKRKYDKTMPVTDEGWWESVLAEEKRYSSSVSRHSPVAHKPVPVLPKKQEASPEAAVAVGRDWDHIADLYRNDKILEVKVVGHNRGGLLVEGEGDLSGFVPFSHLIGLAGRGDLANRDISLEGYEGKKLSVKVIECTPEEERVVFSERAALSESGKRSALFQSLQPGARTRGRVTNITDFGVFVDLGGAEGLIHISELSWGRVTDPGKIVRLGEEIDVQVLDLSAERCRVALSLKRLLPNPWDSAVAEFPEGRVLPATITCVLSYGAFACLDAGVEGLIHASEMPLHEGQTPRDILKERQQVQVRVLHVDPAHQRMGLSMHINP
jgi:small subunit ribosomal protein S1